MGSEKIENLGDELIRFQEYQSEWGKEIKFCHARAVQLACGAYCVTEKAKIESVAISEPIDAAQITKNMYFITAGFKMGDIDAVDPVTKKPLCIEEVYTNIQSRNNVFPTQIMVAKETKESYDAFKGFFDFFAMAGDKSVDREGSPYFWEALDGFQELDVIATIDMSAQWKGLCKGGTCKQSCFFCHCCTCERFCADRLDDDWKCYYHQKATNDVVESMKHTIEQLRANLSASLESFMNSSKICVHPESHHGWYGDNKSIDYNLSVVEDKEQFTEPLFDVLELRSLDMADTMEEMRVRLKESLYHKSQLRQLLDQVSHCEGWCCIISCFAGSTLHSSLQKSGMS
jgi:hypothetical protein